MVEHNFEKSFISTIPTFVDLQGFIIGKKFVVKEVMVLKKGAILFHYIFTCHEIFWQNPKSIAHPGWVLITKDTMGRRNDSAQHDETLIIMAVIDAKENDDNKAVIYTSLKDVKNINNWLIYSIAIT